MAPVTCSTANTSDYTETIAACMVSETYRGLPAVFPTATTKACAKAVAIRMHPFEPTAACHEKMAEQFFERAFASLDPHVSLKIVLETG